MPKSTRRGPVPSELAWLIDELDDYRERIGALEAPDATTTAGVLPYLSSLKTLAAGGAPAVGTGTVANDNVVHWFASSPDTGVTMECPTGRMLVTASVGEASLTPGGSFVIGYVSYSVRDNLGVAIPGATLGANSGRFYTNQRAGISISSGPQLVTIDRATYPGPYLVRAFVGLWVASANTLPCSGTFNDLALVAQVIGEGA